MTKKNICLVIASLKAGGAERVISELANYFAEIGHNVSIVLLRKTDQFYSISNNVKIYEPLKDKSETNSFKYLIKLSFFLRKTFKLISPDTILSFGRGHNSFVLFSSIGLNYPIYVSDRGSPYFNSGILNELFRKILYKGAKGIISQTNYSREVVKKALRHKNIAVIHNPIRIVKKYKTERENSIIMVGRLVEGKGHIYLLKAFQKIINYGWNLLIVGEGPLKESLIKDAERLGIIEKVTFIGQVTDVDKYLSKCKIFAFSSLSEGFPNALVEALGNGLACVTFDCITGPSDIIKDGYNGFLVPVKDHIALSKKIEELILNQKLRDKFSLNAYQITKELDIKKIGREYLNFLTNNLNE